MEKDSSEYSDLMKLAEEIRAACIKTAQNEFRAAAMSGLCMDGAIEAAMGSIQSLDLEKIVEQQIERQK